MRAQAVVGEDAEPALSLEELGTAGAQEAHFPRDVDKLSPEFTASGETLETA